MAKKLGEVIMKQGEPSGSRKAKKIRKGAGRWFFALSRILGIGIILFIGMFALDVPTRILSGAARLLFI